MRKKHHFLGFRRHKGTKLSDSESSEVGSDEEYGLPPAPEDVIMDADYSTVDAEWCYFEKEELIIARNAEGPPCCDVAELALIIEESPGAGRIKGQGCNTYTRFLMTDEHNEQRSLAGLWYPFSCHEEWQVFRWLSSLHISMDKVDEFFSLDYVRSLYLDI